MPQFSKVLKSTNEMKISIKYLSIFYLNSLRYRLNICFFGIKRAAYAIQKQINK